MIQAKLKMPKTKAKTVWAGVYGGHYSTIVFFSTHPIISKEPYNLTDVLNGHYYDLHDNKEKILGSMGLEEFKELYPDADISSILTVNWNPKEVEVTEVAKMRIEAFWEDGHMRSFDFNTEGYA